ncbi:MAG: proline racemase family protein [Planctomycetota bacterium]
MQFKEINVIDSHTGGEPTRIVIDGGPDLGTGPLDERQRLFRDQYDSIRSAIVNEPRGSDVLVGGLLCEPHDPQADFGVIFFNNVDFLGMCGHGLIGLVSTLRFLGRIKSETCAIETPVGLVKASLDTSGTVAVENVASYRHLADVSIEVPEYGLVRGDVAWGGNWFFLVKDSSETLTISNTNHLINVAIDIRDALESNGITGVDSAYIDHVELFCAARDPNNQSRNFVLCPGNAYDRSPCGTGTSAKLACLAADGMLNPGETWRQESIIGSVFECTYENDHEGKVIPTIRGTAHVCSKSTLILNPDDPFCMGIRNE